MPFDEEEDDTLDAQPPAKTGLKKVSTQKSMFDSMEKRPTQEDLNRRVSQSQEQSSSYKVRGADLAMQFNKAMNDKTLRENKNVFSREMEVDLLKKMIQLAIEINNDIDEEDGMGSLSWITLLLKNSISQRDRINALEYKIQMLEKSTSTDSLLKIIESALDSKKNSE